MNKHLKLKENIFIFRIKIKYILKMDHEQKILEYY
jgi:hypothetical protein